MTTLASPSSKHEYWIDMVRIAAMVRVFTYHVSSREWLTLIPAVQLLFLCGGYAYQLSAAKYGSRPAVAQRFRKTLSTVTPYLIAIAILHSISPESGRWASFGSWYALGRHLWFVPVYLLVVALSPLISSIRHIDLALRVGAIGLIGTIVCIPLAPVVASRAASPALMVVLWFVGMKLQSSGFATSGSHIATMSGITLFLVGGVLWRIGYRELAVLTSVLGMSAALIDKIAALDRVGIALNKYRVTPWLIKHSLEIYLWQLPCVLLARAVVGDHQGVFAQIGVVFLLSATLLGVGLLAAELVASRVATRRVEPVR